MVIKMLQLLVYASGSLLCHFFVALFWLVLLMMNDKCEIWLYGGEIWLSGGEIWLYDDDIGYGGEV